MGSVAVAAVIVAGVVIAEVVIAVAAAVVAVVASAAAAAAGVAAAGDSDVAAAVAGEEGDAVDAEMWVVRFLSHPQKPALSLLPGESLRRAERESLF